MMPVLVFCTGVSVTLCEQSLNRTKYLTASTPKMIHRKLFGTDSGLCNFLLSWDSVDENASLYFSKAAIVPAVV